MPNCSNQLFWVRHLLQTFYFVLLINNFSRCNIFLVFILNHRLHYFKSLNSRDFERFLFLFLRRVILYEKNKSLKVYCIERIIIFYSQWKLWKNEILKNSLSTTRNASNDQEGVSAAFTIAGFNNLFVFILNKFISLNCLFMLLHFWFCLVVLHEQIKIWYKCTKFFVV